MTIFSTPGLRPEGFPDGATRQPRPSFYRNLPVLGFLAFLVLGTATAGAQASGPSGVSAPWPHPPATPIDVAQLQPTPAKIYEGGDPPSRYEFTRQLTPNQVKRAGFILPIRTWVGTVIKSYNEERSSLGTGEILYIDMGKAQGVARGDRFTVFSKGRLIKHPVILSPESEGIPDYPRPVGEAHKQFFSRHGKDVGYLVNVLGVIEVTEPGDTHSMAVIRESYN
ncbi:MAG: hypothetical protein GWM98_15130, partial [Nitrospinaceae bacterium]|nr:hypothetical protein [Nitrospinaceae bacterium]NIR55568.1 hypothetical protein [Nitrospinaceae bacterium]NIS86002.1 hypothetical protein [Nitrospinaceae bacterium]NIT82848.1 hypothetical protein [Nitrospinaceae bacterium]NIU45050.1 hypothetical protein [Nitrospinaceae bacterium]